MMIVPASIVLIVGYVSPILWTIGLAFLITGIVVLVAAEKSRHGSGRGSGCSREQAAVTSLMSLAGTVLRLQRPRRNAGRLSAQRTEAMP